MTTLNDAKYKALGDKGFAGSIGDRFQSWLISLITPTPTTGLHINDLWLTFLNQEGFTGQLNDAWFDFLGSLGFTGNINEREYQFWLGGGVYPPAPIFTAFSFTPEYRPHDCKYLGFNYVHQYGSLCPGFYKGARIIALEKRCNDLRFVLKGLFPQNFLGQIKFKVGTSLSVFDATKFFRFEHDTHRQVSIWTFTDVELNLVAGATLQGEFYV